MDQGHEKLARLMAGRDQLADFRKNLQEARKASDMSQEAVAAEMRARRHSFQQQTIQKIESGARTVRLDEAVELAQILGTSIEALLSQSSSDLVVRSSLVRAKAAVNDYVEAISHLRSTEQALEAIGAEDLNEGIAADKEGTLRHVTNLLDGKPKPRQLYGIHDIDQMFDSLGIREASDDAVDPEAS